MPAVDIRALAGIGEADAAGLAARALQTKIEPLSELGVRVGANVHADIVGAIGGDSLDGAGVEAVADLEHEMFGVEGKDAEEAGASRRCASARYATIDSTAADAGARHVNAGDTREGAHEHGNPTPGIARSPRSICA